MLDKYGLAPTKVNMCTIGDKFGRLTVVGMGQKGRYRYYAVCKCDCGIEKSIRCDALVSGAALSCGCLHKDIITTHSLSASPHYSRWRNMIERCENPDNSSYQDYGGRGIKVCERWHDVSLFIGDLPPGYVNGMQMDRIDNDGDYEPGNIRWVTPKRNSSNRRTTRVIQYNGVSRTASEWSRLLGGSHGLVSQRIDEFGWSEEAAVTTPVSDTLLNIRKAQKKRWENHTKKPRPAPRITRTVQFNGKDYTANEIAEMAGKPVKLVRKQLYERGWTVEKVLSNT